MLKTAINIVWMKRDIRSQDHAPLLYAEQAGIPFVIVYLFEPSIITYKDTSLRHLQFQYHAIAAFNQQHATHQNWIHVMYGEAIEVFAYLASCFEIQTMFSYQESGVRMTWERDKKVAEFCKEHQIEWREFQQNGVIRGLKNRKNWEKMWYEMVTDTLIHNAPSKHNFQITHPFALPSRLAKEWKSYPKTFQPAGETFAWQYLHHFLQERGFLYHKHISKPLLSRKSCSRLSPYLAWGNLSIRQVYQTIKLHPAYPYHAFALNAMLMRLLWHCHFIQKFEMECSYETHCVNKGFESLTHANNAAHLQAWKEGKTGYPLVDACMRCLQETGWINFRMRAMLVSFLCHHLDIDWRLGVYHLAQLFLDYEPGIHYPQFQMQAGTTGVNIVRVYNPVKQSMEQDAEGVFIQQWVPELRNVPVEYIHEPWKMSALEQMGFGLQLGVDYPWPIVAEAQASKAAKDKIWGHRKSEAVQKEKQRIIEKHTKNNHS